MTRVFGIITKDVFRTAYWIGTDFRLFDWLRNNETELPPVDPMKEADTLIVRAPSSHLFLHGSILVALNSHEIHTLNSAHLKTVVRVSRSSPSFDKASMVCEHLIEVEKSEFEALNLDADYVLTFEKS